MAADLAGVARRAGTEAERTAIVLMTSRTTTSSRAV